jgi:uncharacterized membrane protein YedE/YeeE
MAEKNSGGLALVTGMLFGTGVCVSGMVRPSKVLAFLDLRGDWDPSLLVVMGTALAVQAIAWAIVRRMRAPLLGGRLPGPSTGRIDARLVGGAALFGLGWGLGGFCPGPAMVSTVSGATGSLVFVASMALGMLGYQWLDAVAGKQDEAMAPAAKD